MHNIQQLKSRPLCLCIPVQRENTKERRHKAILDWSHHHLVGPEICHRNDGEVGSLSNCCNLHQLVFSIERKLTGNRNGEHTALWEVCRAFRRLNENSMCVTGLKKTRNKRKLETKKIKSNQHPLSPPAFCCLAPTCPKAHLPHTTFKTLQILLYAIGWKLFQQLWSQISKVMAALEQTNPSLVCKWKKPHCAQQQWQQIFKKLSYILSCIRFLPSETALTVVFTPSCHGTLAGLLKWYQWDINPCRQRIVSLATYKHASLGSKCSSFHLLILYLWQKG